MQNGLRRAECLKPPVAASQRPGRQNAPRHILNSAVDSDDAHSPDALSPGPRKSQLPTASRLATDPRDKHWP